MKTKIIILIALIITLTPPTFIFLPIIKNYNKTGNNTSVLGKDYSNLTREEIVNKLDQDFQLPPTITLKTDLKEYQLNTASISAQIDKNKIASTILYRRLNEGLFSYVKQFFVPKNFTLNISYDGQQFNEYINDLSTQIDRPFVPSSVQLKSGSIAYTKGEIGQSIQKDRLKSDITDHLSMGQFTNPISIPIENSGSIPDDQKIEAAKGRAQKLIGKSLILTTDKDSITIKDTTIISWLGFENNFNDLEVDDFSQNTSQSLKRDPVDAIFNFENTKVLEFRPSLPGITPKTEELSLLIKDSINKLADSSEASLTASIPVETIEPKIKTSDANDLGIKELIGSGTSTFKHSSATRNHNIKQGSIIVNRILVAPGETFSFIKSLGEVSLESGYKKAYIIRQGRTELDVGGGICQVSTTLFRAMLNSGLDITQRKAHAYRVSYYEEDSPPGYDATVFIPNPDLKFINDTGHYVLIQSTLNEEEKRLTYNIYGTSDGRKVEISNYRKWGAQPPPPTRYIDDPTLPPGKLVKEETAVPGLKTAFDWKVTKDGQVIHQKTFQSNFVPWAAVYRRGI